MEGEIAKILKICETVRSLLIENGLLSLPTYFPIIQKTAASAVSNCQAYALCKHENWELTHPNMQVARSVIIHEVAIGVTDPITNELYPLERIIPTLLHEFAHCITPGILVHKRDGNDKNKSWVFDAHDDTFYNNFSHILELAEKLKIYKLPATFSKTCKISLRRFDKLDVIGLYLGKCELFNSSSSSSLKKINVNVRNEKGEVKLIILEGQNLFEEIQELILKKFTIKKKATIKIHKLNGDSLTSNETLKEYLNSNNVILLRSK